MKNSITNLTAVLCLIFGAFVCMAAIPLYQPFLQSNLNGMATNAITNLLQNSFAITNLTTNGATTNSAIGFNGTNAFWNTNFTTSGGGITNVFGTNTNGLVPASGTNTNNFLRGDGTWKIVSGSGLGTVSNIATTAPITGGTITTMGTIGFDGTLAFNASGSTNLSISTNFNTNGVNAGYVYGITNNGTTLNLVTNPVSNGNNYTHGQCRLIYTSSSVLTLNPYCGPGYIQINGAAQQVPAGGITLSNAGLTASTLYYIYAYMSGATMTLEASATGHSTSNGIEIKTGDSTRTLVGMVYMGAGTPGTFVDTAQHRQVASYFNRANRSLVGGSLGGVTTTSSSMVELSSASRATCVSWGDESTILNISGFSGNNTSPSYTVMNIGINSTTVSSAQDSEVYTVGASYFSAQNVAYSGNLTEGYNYLTVLGKIVTASTATFYVQGFGIVIQ